MKRASSLRVWLGRCFAEGILATPLIVIGTPGNVIVASVFVASGLPMETYGIILSLRFWCNLFQAGVSPLLARHWSARRAYLVFAGVNVALWGAVGVSLARTHPLPFLDVILITLLCGAHATGALGGVAWTSWVREWIPGATHAAFFARRFRWSELTSVLFTLAAGLALTNQTTSSRPFALVLLAACVFRAIGLVCNRGVDSGNSSSRIDAPVIHQLKVVVANALFLKFTLFAMIVAFAMAAFPSFYPMFMLQILGKTPFDLAICAALGTLSGVVVFPLWGRVIKRFGYRIALIIALAAWGVTAVGWCVVGQRLSWMVYLLWIVGGMAGAGMLLTKFSLLLRLAPPAAPAAGVGCHTAMVAIAAALGPFCAGEWLGGADLQTPSLSAYQGFFWLQPAILALALCILWQIRPPLRAETRSEGPSR